MREGNASNVHPAGTGEVVRGNSSSSPDFVYGTYSPNFVVVGTDLDKSTFDVVPVYSKDVIEISTNSSEDRVVAVNTPNVSEVAHIYVHKTSWNEFPVSGWSSVPNLVVGTNTPNILSTTAGKLLESAIDDNPVVFWLIHGIVLVGVEDLVVGVDTPNDVSIITNGNVFEFTIEKDPSCSIRIVRVNTLSVPYLAVDAHTKDSEVVSNIDLHKRAIDFTDSDSDFLLNRWFNWWLNWRFFRFYRKFWYNDLDIDKSSEENGLVAVETPENVVTKFDLAEDATRDLLPAFTSWRIS